MDAATQSAHADFDNLVAHIYDAVTAPTGFQQFIEAFVASFRLKAALMFSRHAKTQETTGLWVTQIEHKWLESYGMTYGAQDMLAHHISVSPVAQFYATNLDLETSDFLKSAFYREWVVPQGVGEAAGAIILQEGSWISQVILQRSVEQGGFSSDELTMFNRLVPHLQRAIQLRLRFADLALHKGIFTGGLEQLAMPAIVVNEFGRVSYSNRVALEIFARNAELWLEDDYLRTRDPVVTRQFNVEIIRAIRTSRGNTEICPGVIRVARQGKRPLMILITPMHIRDDGGNQAAALLFVYDPALIREIPNALVQQLFALTDAESELAVALCAGKTVDDTAAERGTSIHTVRTQLKSIFLKTGTNRQTDLVSMLLASPAYFLQAR
jgi:DNA-binding CsgD family transcriptional regulator